MATLTDGTVAHKVAHGSDGVGVIDGAAAAVRRAAVVALRRAAEEGLTMQGAANASGYKGVYPTAHAWFQALYLLWLC